MSRISLIFVLAGFLMTMADAALTKEEKASIIKTYEKQVCLNSTMLQYWKDMVQLYKPVQENPLTDDSTILGFHYAQGTSTEFFSLLNERNLTIELNIITWAGYIFYKEAVDPPESEKAEKCKQFARFLSWYNRIFSVELAFVYSTKQLAKQIEKSFYHLKQMNTKLLAIDNDDTNVFEKLREDTKYYLCKKDVMPIKELLSNRDYERVPANLANANSLTVEFSTFLSSFRKPHAADWNYEADYHNEIYRRLWLFLGHRPLIINHFLRAYLETTTDRTVPYIENITPPLSLSKMYWDRIATIQDMPTQYNWNVVEKAILMQKEFLDVFLAHMKLKAPKDLKKTVCDSIEQDNYVQYVLKLFKQ